MEEYITQYFTIENLEAIEENVEPTNKIHIFIPKEVDTIASLSYSYDGSNWNTINIVANVDTNYDIPFVHNDNVFEKICIKGTGTAFAKNIQNPLANDPNEEIDYYDYYDKSDNTWKTSNKIISEKYPQYNGKSIKLHNPHNVNGTTYCSRITFDKDVEIYGNIMSLLYGDDFADQETLDTPLAFANLFMENLTLMKCVNLVLPATTLSPSCYKEMFKGCGSITYVPELPAHELADNCYMGMFKCCSNITNTPELPANELKKGSYAMMFSGCEKINFPFNFLSHVTKTEKLSCWMMFALCFNIQRRIQFNSLEESSPGYDKHMYYGTAYDWN